MTNSFDLIIIGGGIMGCSSAYELARRGVKVALFEKKSIGEGPSGESSAIIRQHYSNELTARMALHSLKVFQNFDEQVGGIPGFTKAGFIVMVDEKDRAGLEANVAFQKSLGINTEMLSREDMRELMPHVSGDDLVAMAYEPDSGYADPYLTVHAYAHAARRQGVKIFQNVEVQSISATKSRTYAVVANGEVYKAGMILNAAGAWGNKVASLLGREVPINPCRVQVAFFRRPQGHEKPHPVVADFVNSTYFRPETGGLTLVGLIDPSEANAIVDPDSYRKYVDDEFVLESGERLVRRYPAMERSEPKGGYSSLYAITPDWHPIVDEVPAGSGFYVCSGFSGHGFKLGPAVSVMVADLITKKQNPQFNPSLFRLNRFKENDPVIGRYEYSIVG